MGGEGDIEDRVVDLEDALDDLRAEFEKLMTGEDDADMDDADMADMEAGDDVMGDEDEMMDSVEYDLDEDADEDSEVVDLSQIYIFLQNCGTDKTEDHLHQHYKFLFQDQCSC